FISQLGTGSLRRHIYHLRPACVCQTGSRRFLGEYLYPTVQSDSLLCMGEPRCPSHASLDPPQRDIHMVKRRKITTMRILYGFMALLLLSRPNHSNAQPYVNNRAPLKVKPYMELP